MKTVKIALDDEAFEIVANGAKGAMKSVGEFAASIVKKWTSREVPKDAFDEKADDEFCEALLSECLADGGEDCGEGVLAEDLARELGVAL